MSFCSDFFSTNLVDKLCARNGQFEETKTLVKCDLGNYPVKGAELCAACEGQSRRNRELEAFSETCLLALLCNSVK